MSSIPRARILTTEILYTGWVTLKQISVAYRRRDGADETLERTVAEHGDAAAVLPYDPDRGVVLLARQFRLPAFLNGGHASVLEACAGKLDGDEPQTCARREALEELGYRLGDLSRAFTAFGSPGFDLETCTGFIARYSPADRVDDGGGLVAEGEDIEVIEMDFTEAYGAIATGAIIDAKTIMLLQHLKLSGAMG